jgi:hypothetical protein
VIPRGRRQRLRLLVTPDTILRRHRRRWAADRRAARTADRAPAITSGHWSSGWSARTPNGLPQDPRRSGRPGGEYRGADGLRDPEEGRNRPRAAAHRASLVPVPAFSGRAIPASDFFTVDLLDGMVTRDHLRSRVRATAGSSLSFYPA